MQLGEDILATLDDVAEPGIVDDHRVQPLNVQGALPSRSHRQKIRFLFFALEKWANYPYGLTTVVKGAVDSRTPIAHQLRRLLDSGAGRQEHPHPSAFLHYLLKKSIVEKSLRILAQDLHVSCLSRVERRALDYGRGIEVPRIESRVDCGREPDEATTDALSECETELELRRCLMNLVDHERVGRQNVSILKPTARDSRGHDYHGPARCFRSGFALAVDDADLQRVGFEYGLRDRADRKRLSRTCPRHDSESLSGRGELAHLGAVLLLENCWNP